MGRMALSFKTYGVMLCLMLFVLGLYEEICNVKSPRLDLWKNHIASIPDVDMEIVGFALRNFRSKKVNTETTNKVGEALKLEQLALRMLNLPEAEINKKKKEAEAERSVVWVPLTDRLTR